MEEIFKKSHIEKLHFSGFGDSNEIYILRDDQIHPLIAGNKWRKLKYIIAYLIENGKKRIVTFGGAYSNHLVATAVAGKLFGIETYAFVRGDEKREVNSYEKICLENGMHLKYVSREAYRNKEKLFHDLFAADVLAEFVGEGGAHIMALKGCEEIINELKENYDYIILSLGTGTTMDGMLKAVSEFGIQTQIIGISSLKNNFSLDKIMEKYPRDLYRIEHGYHRGKYATNDQDLKTFITDFKTETGIALEFVYTGKMMMALCDMIRDHKIEEGKKILCIHTGGLPFLMGQ